MLAADQLAVEGGALALALAKNGVVEPGHQGAAADLVGQSGRAGASDLLTVHRGGDVEQHEVARLHGPVDALQDGEPVAQPVDLLVNLGVRGVGVLHRDGDVGVVGQLDLRPDVHLGREAQLLTVGELRDLDLGVAEHLQLALLQRLTVEARHRVLNGFLEDHATADPLIQNARRNASRPETLHPHLGADLLVRSVEARLQLLERDLDREPGPRGAEGLDGALHCVRSPSSKPVGCSRITGSGADRWSGRGDSNSRSPAPKAGALATTLRPAAVAPL